MDLWHCGNYEDASKHCNPHSLTVIFPQPEDVVVKTYQLACYRGEAHVVVMPNVTTALLERFVAGYAQ